MVLTPSPVGNFGNSFTYEAEYCDRVSIMVDSKIEALDSPKNLKKQFQAANMDQVFQQLARKAKRGD